MFHVSYRPPSLAPLINWIIVPVFSASPRQVENIAEVFKDKGGTMTPDRVFPVFLHLESCQGHLSPAKISVKYVEIGDEAFGRRSSRA